MVKAALAWLENRVRQRPADFTARWVLLRFYSLQPPKERLPEDLLRQHREAFLRYGRAVFDRGQPLVSPRWDDAYILAEQYRELKKQPDLPFLTELMKRWRDPNKPETPAELASAIARLELFDWYGPYPPSGLEQSLEVLYRKAGRLRDAVRVRRVGLSPAIEYPGMYFTQYPPEALVESDDKE
jgi:hypothetical protein